MHLPACHEGAIQIIDGKARLVADKLCDGLGDCLGECPAGAITIEEREAAAYDEEAVKKHLAHIKGETEPQIAGTGEKDFLPCGCPSTQVQSLERKDTEAPAGTGALCPGCLSNWPVQLALIPAQAKYLQDANLLIAADCAPLAFGDFHRRFLKGKIVLIACPKLDNIQSHREKLVQIFKTANPRSIQVIRMEVPCCTALTHSVKAALAEAHRDIPLEEVVVRITGEIIS